MSLLAIILAAAIHSSPSVAGEMCGWRDLITESLISKYGEARRGVGVAGSAVIFEIWTSSKSPYTWTILKVYSTGWACVIATGENWMWQPAVKGRPI